MMILQVILEGIGLGVLLILVCAIGIRKGTVGMVHLYSPEVQERCVTLGRGDDRCDFCMETVRKERSPKNEA